MNTILLQKILDILTEGLAHVGDFFKDLFVSDPQDGQVIAYDAETGHWVNKDATEVELDLINTFVAQPIATITDGAENVPMKSLVVDIVPQHASGSDEVVITHTGKNLFDPSVYNSFLQLDGKYKGVANSIVAVKTYLGAYIGKQLTFSVYADLTGSPTPTNVKVAVNINGVTTSGNNINSGNAGYSSVTFTPQSENDFVLITFGSAGGNSYTFYDIQLEASSTRTAYEPYTATTHTVTLSASIENGYIDIISGQGKDTDNDTDITCTPTTIKTMGGTESIFADSGDVSGEYYTKTAENVLALANITEDITSDITKNTTDFSDILLKVSQNNKVVSVEIYSATTAAAVNVTFLSNLPKPAMNSKVLLVNTTLGEDGTILGTLKTSGELEIATPGAKSFSGLITYVAK